MGPIKMFGAVFSAIGRAAAAVEKLAAATDNLAGIAEAETQGLADQMTVERTARIANLTAKLLPGASP